MNDDTEICPKGCFNPPDDELYDYPLTHWVRIEMVGHIMAAAQSDIHASGDPDSQEKARGLKDVHEDCQRFLKLQVPDGETTQEFVQVGAVRDLLKRLQPVAGPGVGHAEAAFNSVLQVIEAGDKDVAGKPLGAVGHQGVVPVAFVGGGDEEPLTIACIVDERMGGWITLGCGKRIIHEYFRENYVEEANESIVCADRLLDELAMPSYGFFYSLPVPAIIDKAADEVLVQASALPLILGNVVYAVAHGSKHPTPDAMVDGFIGDMTGTFEAIADQAGLPEDCAAAWLSESMRVATSVAYYGATGDINGTTH